MKVNVIYTKMATPDPLYLGLLGTAENFRTSNPPNIRLCIQCLQGVLNCKPPPRIEARTHLQLGTVLLNFSENPDTARHHLEQAVNFRIQSCWFHDFVLLVLPFE